MTTKNPAIRLLGSVLHDLISPCLQEPSRLKVTSGGSPDLPVYEVQVSPRDMGRIVGKGGANILTLRGLVKAMAAGQHLAAAVLIAEPNEEHRGRPVPRGIRWDFSSVQEAVRNFLDAAGHPAPVSIVNERSGRMLVLIGRPLPEDIEAPLERWISLMGIEGGTRLVLDGTSAAI